MINLEKIKIGDYYGSKIVANNEEIYICYPFGSKAKCSVSPTPTFDNFLVFFSPIVARYPTAAVTPGNMQSKTGSIMFSDYLFTIGAYNSNSTLFDPKLNAWSILPETPVSLLTTSIVYSDKKEAILIQELLREGTLRGVPHLQNFL